MSFVSLSPYPLSVGKGVRYERNVVLHFFSSRCVSQPRLAAPLAPSKGRGSRGRSLFPMEGGVPKGRIRIKRSAVLCKSIYESSIIKQVIWTGWGLVTSSGVTLLQNR